MEYSQFLSVFALIVSAIVVVLMQVWKYIQFKHPITYYTFLIEAIVTVDPQHYLAFICKAVVNYFRANYEESLADLEQSVTLNPDEWDAYFWQGMNLAQLGRDKEAIEAVEQALKLDLPPDLLSPLRWLEQERPEFYQKHALPLLDT